jgi:hypothetical protein
MLSFSFTGTWAIVLYVVAVLVLFGTFLGQQRTAFNWIRKRFFQSDEGVSSPRVLPHTAGTSSPTASTETEGDTSVDLRILDLKSTGGGSTYVDFSLDLANYGGRQCRCTMAARIGDVEVQCLPQTLDLIPNTPPQNVRVLVPRPELGDLVAQFGHETTLYDRTLHIEASAEKSRASSEWHEKIYDRATEAERYEIQRRVWRRSRGEETADDLRAEVIENWVERRDRGDSDSDRYENV